jgi:DNA polymerase I-like protein with 3'-5' exonuclease and polymerase domains
MAQVSRDPTLIKVLQQGMNVHSFMGAQIAGQSYDEFHARFTAGDSEAYEIRQAGKLLNLSCQYRISAPALTRKFFSAYDLLLPQSQIAAWLNLYKRTFSGIPRYWAETARTARALGYAETIAKRRVYLRNQTGWSADSTAINTPVQGSGADQKYLVIWKVSEAFPEVTFLLDMHDGLYWSVPSAECAQDMKRFINDINYQAAWDTEVLVPLRFDVAVGANFKDKKEI